MTNTKLLGIITARGGSKGIPHKNLYPIAGMPLIYYCIENAKRSGIFDRLIISTDSDKIAEVAQEHGVDYPFKRPVGLAEDGTPHFEVIKHALALTPGYDYAAIIQPTAPLIQGFHWREAWGRLLETGADSIISVYPIPYDNHPLKAMLKMGEYLLVHPARKRGLRRQDLLPAYKSTGGIYMFKTSLIEQGDFYGERPTYYEVDEEYALDINEESDLDEARCRIAIPCYPSIKEDDEKEYDKLCKSMEGEMLG